MKHRIVPSPLTDLNETWLSLSNNPPDLPLMQDHIDPIISAGDAYSKGIEDAYSKIAIDIIAETAYDYRYPVISEKTMRAISARKMFILVAPLGTIQRLHDIGFQTFDPFINEAYDSITDPLDRINAVNKEIDKIVSIPLDDIKQQMLKYKDRLDYNQKLLAKIYNDSISKIRNQLCSN